ncbi:MAG: class I SAM-dependent methyltransferase [Chloroflexota bacterium]|nr:class I SAM-dependent methyltransferase [Chloroflexota bacterium]
MKRLIIQTFGRQFGHPRGPLGQLVARLMRTGNAPLNLWMVGLLAVGPQDRVLEVGFGPGVALAALLARASDGFVAGIDLSGLMVRRARSRHADAIAAGRLEIRQGDAGSLPDEGATFDTVCGTHVIYFWPDAVATVRELRRVLRPGGTLALAYQERERMPPPAKAGLSQAGATLYGPGEVERVIRAAGFEDVRVETQVSPDGPAGFCVLATK